MNHKGSGLCRFNRKGLFNTPYGRHPRSTTRPTSPPTAQCLPTGPCDRRLRRTEPASRRLRLCRPTLRQSSPEVGRDGYTLKLWTLVYVTQPAQPCDTDNDENRLARRHSPSPPPLFPQQVAGTAEEKVPYEIICLVDAMAAGEYARAYLVLGGEGWTLRRFFMGETLQRHLHHAHLVTVLSLEDFVARANRGRL